MSDVTTPPQAPPDLERRLATILCADVAGYSRMMGENEERTVRVFRGHREIFEALVAQHRGRIFNTAGDALLAEFSSAVEAVRCATDIQAALRTRNEHLAPDERMQFRIGINLGDVIVQGGDLLGDGVNVAARIQQSTEPGGICISGSVYEQIQNKLSLDFKLLGELPYKNIAKPIRTYTINEGAAVTRPARSASSKAIAAIAGAIVLVAAAVYWGYGQLEQQRAERSRVEAQLAAEKQATGEAQRAVDEAKREAQRVAEEAKREVQRVAEEAKREAQVRAQKQAAEDALRRAQEERNRLEQDRKQLETEKQAAESAKKQVVAGPRALPPRTARYDGVYNGQLCNQSGAAPECWSTALVVRDGLAEGSWLSRTKKTATARGTILGNGEFQLNLASWNLSGLPTDALLAGRVAGGVINASGKWSEGGTVTGQWSREPAVAPATATKPASQAAARFDGNYQGQLCLRPRDKPSNCWTVELLARNGRLEGSWMSRVGKTSHANGTINADGAVEMKLHGWSAKGDPSEASVTGRVANDTLAVSGRWPDTPVTGSWTRSTNHRR